MLLRKSATLASLASNRTLAAITCSLGAPHLRDRWIFLSRPPTTVADNGSGSGGVREFHVRSGPLELRASSVLLQSGYAVADYSDEERSVVGKKDNDERLEISKLGISSEIVSALAKKGITKLFPIQRAVLEPAMQGRDMIGRAKTGTGKTLAFGIPIVDKIIRFNAQHGRGRNPLCLVLAPTRELAKQVDKEFYECAPNLDSLCVYGGTPISRQMSTLNYGVDVVVGTPGRVIDLLQRRALDLSEVQFVVLDEADQMLNVGFAEDVEKILENMPTKRQTMMFSATMPNWIRDLTRKFMKDPTVIDLVGHSDQKLAEGISLYSILSDSYAKASIIGPLLTEGNVLSSLRQSVMQIDWHMLWVKALDVSLYMGILVIHYELPNSSEIFVHRSGRTGRAGKKGTAILIHTEQEMRAVRSIEREVGCKFTELPSIPVEGGSRDMFSDFGGRGGGWLGDSGVGRGSGGSSFGRFGGYRGSGMSRSGGSGDSAFSRFGGGSGSGRSSNYGGSGFGRSGGFADSNSSGRSSGFGDFGSGQTGRTAGGFGNSRSSSFGDFGGQRGQDQTSHFGDFGAQRDDANRKPF
ncbi:DEAD/DEAH box helicase domain [Dillenia turbinata]|uniref:DEAD/DEAH box helicase domain n=1 Tax=Dillenia turbinata TaxID=194707 RepID=A0AAN8YXQ2_9MAGN